MGSKGRAEYLSQRRDALKMVAVMIERDALDQLDDVLRAEGETRSAWIRRVIYEKAGYQKKGGLEPVDGVYATCPRCGKQALTKDDLEQLFGWRVINGCVRPQSWCVQCRAK